MEFDGVVDRRRQEVSADCGPVFPGQRDVAVDDPLLSVVPDIPLHAEKFHRIGQEDLLIAFPGPVPDAYVAQHSHTRREDRCLGIQRDSGEVAHQVFSVDHARKSCTAGIFHQNHLHRLPSDCSSASEALRAARHRQVDRRTCFAYSSGVNGSLQVHEVADRLKKALGSPDLETTDPVETLVLTILSQNTTDRNRDRAYAALRSQYADWSAVLAARPDELAAVIRPGGLHHQKARHIQTALARIRATRSPETFELGFLEQLSTQQALEWLTSLPGVGKKTAGIVLLFSFGKAYFPVDTHITRIAKRLGWIGPRERDPHSVLNAWITEDPPLMRDLHLLLIELGRAVCRARRPACDVCPLHDVCPTGRHTQSEGGTVALPGEAR